jgi:CRISPR system Cascade subunit CasA
MSQANWNLLTQPLLHALPAGWVSLPGLLARLVRDEVDSFPALRPHQAPAWHMFLVQLAALALHRAGTSQLPQTEPEWIQALRGLTPEFPEDEPWRLVVDDWSKPAFLQPPVPAGVTLKTEVSTPDELDLLITSKNHDLKQVVAQQAEEQDWIYALVSLQTSEGVLGRMNYGIARMNGGFSSRPMLGLSPLSQENSKFNTPRPGMWFRRDVAVLLATRKEELEESSNLGYAHASGLGLTWLAAWNEEEQLTLGDLDIWFVEVCRRIRLSTKGGRLMGRRGTSKASRIAAEHLKGAVGDPWAPIERTENKSLTLSEGHFDYAMLVRLLLSGDYKLPVLARPSELETEEQTLAFVAQAVSRGQGRTFGFKSRVLPIGGKISHALTLGPKRKELHELAKAQVAEIVKFDGALRDALALAAAGGQRDNLRKYYSHSDSARACFDRAADEIFFDHLWVRYQAQEEGGAALKSEANRFAHALYKRADVIFEASLPGIPCPSLYRPRAEARARSRFHGKVRSDFPELFPSSTTEEDSNVVA